METIKAGCFLINKITKSIAIVYRKKQNDYSFPKGHLEKGETIEECAIKETEEETKRKVAIIKDLKPYIEKYFTPKGEYCVCYMFFAFDNGKSDNQSTDTHDTYWIKIDEVEKILSYDSLKKMWNIVLKNIKKLL